MPNTYTDKDFWQHYWESKQGLVFKLNPQYLFGPRLLQVVTRRNYKTAIEIGGFPGYYAAFLKIYAGMQTTLLDFYIHRPVLQQLLQANALNADSVEVIETDLFAYTPARQYDLVISAGFIEHFDDTEDMVARHAAFAAPGGTVFITLPNFHSLNGWFQRRFDVENYNKHNLASMDIGRLAKAAAKAGLVNVTCHYYGRFGLWLENERHKPKGVRALRKATWLAGKALFKVLPVETRAFSPYIILTGIKPA